MAALQQPYHNKMYRQKQGHNSSVFWLVLLLDSHGPTTRGRQLGWRLGLIAIV
jgi:hypothetical protein